MNVIRKSPHLLGHLQPVIYFTQDDLNKASAAYANANKAPDRKIAIAAIDTKFVSIMQQYRELNIKLSLIDLFFLTDQQDSDNFFDHMAEQPEKANGEDIFYYMRDYGGTRDAIDILQAEEADSMEGYAVALGGSDAK